MKILRMCTILTALLALNSFLTLNGISFAQQKDTHFTLATGGIGFTFPIKAKINAGSDALAGQSVNFIEDLDMSSNFTIPDFDIPYEFADKHCISVSYGSSRYSGNTTLADPVSFNGNIYPTGIDVDSTYSQDIIELEYSYGFFTHKKTDLFIIGGVGYISNKVKLDTPRFGKQVAKVESVYPILGAGLSHKLTDKIDFDADFTNGMLYTGNTKIFLFESSASLTYNFVSIKFLSATGGYSFSMFEGRRVKNKLSFYDHGPFFVLEAHF